MKKRKKVNIPVLVGSLIIGFFVVIAIIAPAIVPYDPSATSALTYGKPSPEHLLGTNDVGQDIFSELIYGTRISMVIGIFAAVVVTCVGTLLALLSAWYGGVADKLITGLTNLAMAVPGLALTTLLVCYLTPGILSIVVAISITAWTGTTRVLRSQILALKEEPFVKIEKAIGQRDIVVMGKHLLPNLKDIILSRGAMAVSSAMMTEASLSFLGLGAFGEKSWGAILHYAFFRNGVVRGLYWWYLPPILCTSLAVLGFMLVGYYGQQKR